MSKFETNLISQMWGCILTHRDRGAFWDNNSDRRRRAKRAVGVSQNYCPRTPPVPLCPRVKIKITAKPHHRKPPPPTPPPLLKPRLPLATLKLKQNLFLGGDYKFIVIMLGLNGATANNCECAWCKIHRRLIHGQ